MSIKDKKIHTDINVAIKSIRYFIPIAWRLKKKYFILMVINLLANTIHPFVDIILLPLIIDELINARRPEIVIM